MTAESVSGSVAFDPDLAAPDRRRPRGGDWPIIPTQAGHDAGILSAAGIPTAMLFVRNPTGVSHSPDEHAEMADCLAGVEALADTLERLAGDRRDGVPPRARLARRRRRDGVLVAVDDVLGRGRGTAGSPRVTPGCPASRRRRTGCPASPSPGSPTPTATPSTGRCAGAPSASAARSGPGASRCTPSPGGSTRTPTSPSPGRPTARWPPPGSRASGEFHYLHHQPDGTPYDDPNAMGHALVEAAREAGIRITLLDTSTSRSGFGAPPEGAQVRYGDGDARTPGPQRVAGPARQPRRRSSARRSTPCAPCPRDQTSTRSPGRAEGRPLHVHLSEQVAENDACLAAYGVTPTELLADHGLLGPRHHRRPRHPPDRRRHRRCSASAGTLACFCPTTERDLGDGIGPSRALHDAGAG